MTSERRPVVTAGGERFAFTGSGTIYSLTTVRLDEGALVTAQITDVDEADPPRIGDRVEMVTRRLTTEGERGMIVYGYKFRKPIL
jgi:uncharacterized OB-fold protein